jgi:site-specific DNA-methyltransferase (adenine-specific)/modification methylase
MIELDKIYNEDCLVGMQRIPDGMVDAIITDLPYGVLNEQSEGGQWDSIIPLEPMWEQFLRVTKPDAPIVLFGSGMFTAKLMMSQPKIWRYNLIWDKVRATGFLNANRMPLRNHEDICVFYRKLGTYNPQMEALNGRERNHTQGHGNHKEKNSCYGKVGRINPTYKDKKHPRSIIVKQAVHCNEDQSHPTQKPVDLLRYLVLTYSNTGGVILDATIGSGTTAVAALMEKRHFIGFETNPEYFAIAQQRIDKIRRQPTLF